MRGHRRPLAPGSGWALDLDAVEAAIRPETRVVSVNFPNNPTGALIPAADLARLAAMCEERGIHLFSDEVYRGLELDPARTLPQAADLSPTALSLNVTSKSLGLPGLRIGWIACRDRELRSRLERAKHYTTICNSAPSEVLARVAIKARDRILERNRGIIAANLPRFEAFFAEFGDLFEWRVPDGGCVAFPATSGATASRRSAPGWSSGPACCCCPRASTGRSSRTRPPTGSGSAWAAPTPSPH
ncbi:pyridoxal phosphate-dependent aminotransferase [Nonomuraea rubra]|uniref:pyridoxal phosphate-dependent aminotransferase n=1 Tax=Nonomuraea rubra TaxID=46180 RepID=UPI00361E63C7